LSYVLVNRFNEIVHTCDSESLKEAKNYFIGIKKMDGERFDSLWRVMNRKEYDTILGNKPLSVGTPYQWWEEDKKEYDDALSGNDGLG